MSDDPLDLIQNRLTGIGKKGRRTPDKVTAQCPAHNDGTPSFAAWRGTSRDVVMKCQAGCSNDAIMAALGLQWTDFGDQTAPKRDAATATYVYRDTKGRPIYRVLRRPGKQFSQEHVAADGSWLSGLNGVQRVPYHLDELVIATQHDRPIWIAEGEKDVDRLKAEGVCATCNSGGAQGWKDELDQHFNKLSDVTIVADKDEPGIKWATGIKDRLEARGCTVRIVTAAAGKDAFDHLEAGLTLAQFVVDGEVVDNGPAWELPTPLTPEVTPAPFPVHVLPEWMRRHILSQADSIQAPVDLHGILGLGAISVATLGKIKVSYPLESWVQPCNLYAVVAVPPSVGKSPAKNAMFKPLEEYEQQLMDDARKARRTHQDRIDVVVSKITAHKKTMISDDSFTARGLLDDYNGDLHDLETEMPPNGRLMADDATVEALGMVIADAGGAIGVVSAEGGLFDRLAGLYNENGINLDLYLEGWGGGKYTVDRVKRDPINIPHANVAVITTVQPTTIDDIGAKKVFAARGLVARFLLSMPHCNVGYRDRKRKTRVDEAAATRYASELTSIATYYAQNHAVFELNDDACGVFADWDQLTEYRLQPDGDLTYVSTWVGKLRANVLRLAALLHVAHGRPGAHVGPQSVNEAIELAEYFTMHMLMIADRWGADETTAQARLTLDWIGKGKHAEFTIRDLHRGNQRLFGVVGNTIPVLQVLTDSGHIRPLFDGPIAVGRPSGASPRFVVNPSLSSLSSVIGVGGEEPSVHSVTKRGIYPPYLSISDDSPHPCLLYTSPSPRD